MAQVWTSIGEKAVQAVGASTETAPTLATEGMDAQSLQAFTLVVECDLGQTFASAAGQLDLYWWDPVALAWVLVVGLSQPMPAEAIGLRRFALSFTTQNARQRLAFVPSGLAPTSGGITCRYFPTTAFHPARLA